MSDAQEYAARINAAIDLSRLPRDADPWLIDLIAADRERVASDLRAIERAEEGLRAHLPNDGWCEFCRVGSGCPDARRYAEARHDAWARLRLTGSLYGVTE